MILQVKTEKELIALVESLKKEVEQLKAQSNYAESKLFKMQSALNEKPNTVIKETVIKEKEKPVINNKTIIKTDDSVLPTLKKLSERLKALEERKPEKQIIKELTTHEIKSVDSASKKQIDLIKKSISEIKPVVNNITEGVTDKEVLEMIKKYVTMDFINKLYKKGK